MLSDYIHDHHGGMKQTMSFMVVMLASAHFVVYAAVFAATGGYTFTQMAAFTGAKASSLISSFLEYCLKKPPLKFCCSLVSHNHE